MPSPKHLGQQLLRAAEKGCTKDIQSILATIQQVGGSLDERNLHGMTALMLAAEAGHVEATRVLVNAHVAASKSLNSVDSQGSTALALAAGRGHVGVVRLLVEALFGRREDINVRDCYGLSPLTQAALNDSSDTMVILLEALSRAGENPFPDAIHANHELSLAASKGSLKALQVLINVALQSGRGLDVPDSNGQTPLMAAIENGQRAAADLLIQSGACMEAVEDSGNSARFYLSQPPQQGQAHKVLPFNAGVSPPAAWPKGGLSDFAFSYGPEADESKHSALPPHVVRL